MITSFQGSGGELRQALGQAPVRDIAQQELPLTAQGAEFIFDQLIHSLGERSRAIYGLNLSLACDGMSPLLSDVPLHVSPAFNGAVGDMPGINIPTFYLGTRASFTEIHVEDGLLDSVNALRWGGDKLWLVIHPHFYHALETNLSEEIRNKSGAVTQDWLPGCGAPTHHKNLVISPALLREWGIPFEVILQSPGDLVYLGCGVPHQVINLGNNFCEAVNVGSDAWKEGGHTFVTCSCPGRVLQYVEVPPLGRYPCEVPGCPAELLTREAARQHALSHQGRETFDCLECSKVYLSFAAFREHRHRVHRKEACPECGNMVAYSNLQRHIASHRRASEEGTCPHCGVSFPNQTRTKQHAARCPRRPKP